MYNLHYSHDAKADLSILNTLLVKRILNKLDWFALSENIFIYAKPLTGLPNRYRFRIGNYRVIFSMGDNELSNILFILKIGHRKNVYKTSG